MRKSLGAKTIVLPTPVWVIGTYDASGNPNLMTVSWAGICCSKPPCLQISVRKETSTYHNLMRKPAFTVNIPTEKHLKEVDYLGMVSGKMQDKFSTANLTAEKASLVDAPCVQEFPLILECKVTHTLEIGVHTMFVGEIMDVQADESVVDAEGMLDVMQLKPMIFAPQSHCYHSIGNEIGKAFSAGAKLINTSAEKISF